MDELKKETSVLITSWDLNSCLRSTILPHSKSDNKLEKRIRRRARRKLKEQLNNIEKYEDYNE